jgi:hypothetical protein
MGFDPNPSPRRIRAGAGCAAVILAGLGAMLASGCSRVSVHTVVDPSATFRSDATFAFLPDGGRAERAERLPRRLRRVEDPLYQADLQMAIRADLETKGLRPVPAGDAPDLQIGYQTVVRNQADVMPPIYGVGWRGRAYVAAPGHVRWYQEGSLVIDVIDARSGETVWRGIGTGAMRDMAAGDDVQSAVKEVLKDFPPK